MWMKHSKSNSLLPAYTAIDTLFTHRHSLSDGLSSQHNFLINTYNLFKSLTLLIKELSSVCAAVCILFTWSQDCWMKCWDAEMLDSSPAAASLSSCCCSGDCLIWIPFSRFGLGNVAQVMLQHCFLGNAKYLHIEVARRHFMSCSISLFSYHVRNKIGLLLIV